MATRQTMYADKSKAHFYRIWYVSETKSTYAILINPTTHQTIIVTNDGVDYRKSFLAKANSTYTVDVVPDEGYLAGTLNTTGGTVTSDISITVTSATMDPKYESYTLTIIQSDNQTITVVCNHNTYTDTFKDKKGSSYVASIDSVAGYIPGTLSSTSGTLDSDTTISATAAEAVDLVGYAPKHITNYESITAIPDENMAYINKAISHAINVSGMLFGCTKLRKVDTTGWDTSNVTNMSNMFSCCYYLESLDLSNFNTSNVTDMDSMFSGCNSLASLDLSNFDTSKVTNMLGMFSVCSNLVLLDLSNFNTSKVTDMSYMFSECAGLTTIKGIIDMKSCTNYDSMFNKCTKLTGVKIKNPPSDFASKAGLSASQYTVVTA